MLKTDTHTRAMERLEQLIDPDWVAESNAVQQALWDGRPFTRLPCIVSTPTPPEWPTYSFTERWNDVEKQFIHLMGGNYVGALLDMEPVHYLHLGNLDLHDLLEIARRIAGKQKILLWSGSLERIREAYASTGNPGILALPENRYGAKDLADARERLARVRSFQTIPKAAW